MEHSGIEHHELSKASHDLAALVAKLLCFLADADYAAVLGMCSNSRFSLDDLENSIKQHGQTIVDPPSDLARYLDLVVIEGHSIPAWSVRSPIWTLEEGLSDLTLELTVTEEASGLAVELDDIEVL